MFCLEIFGRSSILIKKSFKNTSKLKIYEKVTTKLEKIS